MQALLTTPGRPGTIRLGTLPDAAAENRVLVGSVNARPDDWRGAVAGLEEIQRRRPGSLEAMIGLRVAPDRFAEAFAFRGVKATLVFD